MDSFSSRTVPILGVWSGAPMEGSSKKSEEKPSYSRTSKTLSAEKLQNHYDISFEGNFEQARERASTRGKHLLVYINDQEMQSGNIAYKLIYDDIWRDAKIKQKLCEHFVFWQVSITDSAKLQKFLQTYEVHHSPYTCILDPNTGETLYQFDRISRPRVLSRLSKFVLDYPSAKATPNRKKRKRSIEPSSDLDVVSAAFASNLSLGSGIGDAPSGKRRCQHTDDTTSTSSRNPPRNPYCTRSTTRKSLSKVVDTARAGQLHGKRSSSDDENGLQPSSKRHSAMGAGSHHTAANGLPPSSPTSPLDNVCEVVEEHQPTTTQPKSVSFIVRCVDGSRLSWKMSVADRIQNLMEKMEEAGFDRNYHDLIAFYPMRNMGLMSMTATLDAAGLNKEEVLYIREKDDDDE